MYANCLSQKIDALSEFLGRLVAWFSLIIVLTTSVIVIMRYGFDMGSIALQEITLYLHSAVFLIGAGYTLKYNEHVRVDVFYAQMSQVKQYWVNLLGGLLLLLPVCIFILIVSWPFVSDSWMIFEGSSDAGGLPFVYILKSLIPLFAITLILQGISEIIKAGLGIVDCKAADCKTIDSKATAAFKTKGDN